MCWFVPMQIKGWLGFFGLFYGFCFVLVFLRILEVEIVVNER